MSNTTKSIIARQWQIIDFLLQVGNYVSTAQIQSHLKEKGMEAEMRTIQRDLKLLQEIIPLECRTDDKPYSWRWQRLDNANEHQLNLTQAVAFRLIETELKQHISADLMLQLEPILMKARFVLAMANVPESIRREMVNQTGKIPKGHHQGLIQPNSINQVMADVHRLLRIFNMIENPFSAKSVKITKSEKLVLKDLKKALEKLDVPELLAEVESLT